MKPALLSNILPEPISDEAAYQLIECFNEIAYRVEQQYFAQARRHVEKITPQQTDYYDSSKDDI